MSHLSQYFELRKSVFFLSKIKQKPDFLFWKVKFKVSHVFRIIHKSFYHRDTLEFLKLFFKVREARIEEFILWLKNLGLKSLGLKCPSTPNPGHSTLSEFEKSRVVEFMVEKCGVEAWG